MHQTNSILQISKYPLSQISKQPLPSHQSLPPTHLPCRQLALRLIHLCCQGGGTPLLLLQLLPQPRRLRLRLACGERRARAGGADRRKVGWQLQVRWQRRTVQFTRSTRAGRGARGMPACLHTLGLQVAPQQLASKARLCKLLAGAPTVQPTVQ